MPTTESTTDKFWSITKGALIAAAGAALAYMAGQGPLAAAVAAVLVNAARKFWPSFGGGVK